MNSNQSIENIVKVYIKDIISHYVIHDTPPNNIPKLIHTYTKNFINIFEKNKQSLMDIDPNHDNYQNIVQQFMDAFEILSTDHINDKKFLKDKIILCLDEIIENNLILNIEEGICCFCGGECNPMSQSCGFCARGLSGIAVGIPVPKHLKHFL